MNSPLLLVHTTVGDRQAAERLAALLVEGRLAACVSIGAPVTSVYPWEGRIESAGEVPLTIKTSPERWPDLRHALVEAHPYDVPECLAVPVLDGNEAYLAWARDWMHQDKK